MKRNRGNTNDSNRASGYAKRVSILYGARTANRLAGIDDFRQSGFDVHLATDDGSLGPPQKVTQLLQDLISNRSPNQTLRVASCGPEPMMEAVAKICETGGISCEVSLETPMACGIGICFSCVAKVRQQDGQWDYQRTCVEGPIFPSNAICWE